MRRQRPELDKYDVAILSALARNTRLTTVEIASQVHLSRTAVSRRIASLRRSNALSDGGDILNYESIGFQVRATVELAVQARAAAALRTRLLQLPEVLSVAVLAGDGPLSLDVIAFDMAHLHDFVKQLQENGDTTTKVIFAAQKSPLTLVERMQLLNGKATGHLDQP